MDKPIATLALLDYVFGTLPVEGCLTGRWPPRIVDLVTVTPGPAPDMSVSLVAPSMWHTSLFPLWLKTNPAYWPRPPAGLFVETPLFAETSEKDSANDVVAGIKGLFNTLKMSSQHWRELDERLYGVIATTPSQHKQRLGYQSLLYHEFHAVFGSKTVASKPNRQAQKAKVFAELYGGVSRTDMRLNPFYWHLSSRLNAMAASPAVIIKYGAPCVLNEHSLRRVLLETEAISDRMTGGNPDVETQMWNSDKYIVCDSLPIL
jgi:hypothetical protein